MILIKHKIKTAVKSCVLHNLKPKLKIGHDLYSKKMARPCHILSIILYAELKSRRVQKVN